jgi:hypothetical protein
METASYEVVVEVLQFQPLSEGTREDRMLHALEYIAQAMSVLMSERVAQHGVGRSGIGT